jgi:hypothetical protein
MWTVLPLANRRELFGIPKSFLGKDTSSNGMNLCGMWWMPMDCGFLARDCKTKVKRINKEERMCIDDHPKNFPKEIKLKQS